MSVSALNPLQPCSAIIFDCDGTLVDSTRLYFRAWNTLFKRHGAEMPWVWFAAHLGCSWPQIFDEYQRECDISLDAAAALQLTPTLHGVISAKSRWLLHPVALARSSMQ